MCGGFTLIETLIYIALLSVVVSIFLGVFYQILGSNVLHRDRVEVDAEANFVMSKIVWGVTGASAINQPAVGATSTSLSVSKFNYNQNPIVFTFVGGNIAVSESSGTQAILNSGRVKISGLVFEHLSSTNSAPEGIRARISVVSNDSSATLPASTTLESNIYLIK